MPAGDFLGLVVAAGLGGFDPAPALIGAAALGTGVRRRHLVGFGSALILGTAVWGMMLTALLGARAARVDWHAVVRGGATAAWIELGMGLGLVVWAGWRWRVAGRRASESPRSSPTGLYVTAAGFIAIVAFDVPFEILAAASAHQPGWQVGVGWVLWAVISQSPLALLVCAVVAGRDRRLVQTMTWLRERLASTAHRVLGAMVGLAGLFLIADAVRFLALGRFLVG